ncbi:hypothetical protein [Terrimonas pollutisoli]|uniref:hypothetical protein n=1 Tax=Terrimonas pollutisoli TaxID=3034147 RepID=UPI0023ECB260|nr:hypothetical protein [Terrimonas sp. H1YJ31]
MTLLFGGLTGCSDTPKKVTKDEQQYSSNQRYLFQLLDDYERNYRAAKETNEREKIRAIFQDRMKQFLVDSLGRYIDSMTVIVDSVVQKDWVVTTQFHSRNIEFTYGMKFQDSMPPSGDSMYQFMKGFTPGQQVNVGFVHLGGGELNYPDDKSRRTMRIFAYPVPLKTAN